MLVLVVIFFFLIGPVNSHSKQPIDVEIEKGTSTKPMIEYAEEKLSKLDKYIENAENVTANILVKYRPNGTKVEATIPIKSLILRAEEVQPDYYAAVDVVLDKLERQIKKNKLKTITQRLKIHLLLKLSI